MLSSEDDIFWIYASLHGKTQKKAARNPKNPETARRLCRTSLSSRKGDKIPPNTQKREKCPEFRLSRPRTYKPSSRIQKSQIRAKKRQKRQMSRHSNPAYTPRTLSQAKKHPKIPPKNKERHLNDAPITRPPHGRRANMYKPKPPAKIPINTTPRTKKSTKTSRKPLSPKIYNKKNFRKYTPKR